MNEIRNQTIVLAYDPGLVTGWAMFNPLTEDFTSGQIEGRHNFYAAVEGVMAAGYLLEVVGEKFVIGPQTQKKTKQYDALYINGVMDYWSMKHGFKLTLQTPAQAKGFASDDKLKALDWYKPTTGGHANDATRHLLTYVVSTKTDLSGSRLLDRILGEA